MSATCTFCGGNLAPGVLHDPKQCAPERGLDFEKAKLEAVLEYYGDGKPLSWDTDKYEAALNAQVAERIAAARQEEQSETAYARMLLDSAEKEVSRYRDALERIAQGGGHSGDVASEALEAR